MTTTTQDKLIGWLKAGNVKAYNAWRKTVNSRLKISFSGIDLHGVKLRGVNLRRVNIQRSDLSEGYFALADLHSADLSGADLTGADLGAANLVGADLTGANLQRTDLRNTNLPALSFDVWMQVKNLHLAIGLTDPVAVAAAAKQWDIANGYMVKPTGQ